MTSPTATRSFGCLTYLFDIFEIWTKPSCLTPISTKIPKSTTFLTVPCNSMPGFKSSIDKTFFFNKGFCKSSRKSRSGRLSASTISRNVSSPISSSLATSVIFNSVSFFCNFSEPRSDFSQEIIASSFSVTLYVSG